MKFTLGAMVFIEGRDARVLEIWNNAVEFFEKRISAV
jgi:hypothetical protein